MSVMPGCDYGVSADYRICMACGAKRPVSAMAGGPRPVCADLDWCLHRQRALKASGATRPPNGWRRSPGLRKRKGGGKAAIRRGAK